MGEIVRLQKLWPPTFCNAIILLPDTPFSNSSWARPLREKLLVGSQMRQNYSLNIVALQKRVPFITEEGKSSYRIEINDSPMPMDVIEADDVVVLVGSEKNFDRLFNDLAEV